MNREFGQVLAVTPRAAGSSLTTGAAVGDTVLFVEDAFDFNEGGGSIFLDETVLPYIEANPDEDTITLAAPLAFDVDEELYVSVWDALAGGVVTEHWATVDIEDSDGGDPYDVVIPHDTIDKFPDAIRAETIGETVEIRRDDPDGEWYVAEIVGKTPVVIADFVSTTTGAHYYLPIDSFPAFSGSWQRLADWTAKTEDGVGPLTASPFPAGWVEITKPGRYLVTATLFWPPSGNTVGIRRARLVRAAGVSPPIQISPVTAISPEFRAAPASTGETCVLVVHPVYLTEHHWLAVETYQDSGSDLAVAGDQNGVRTTLTITYLGG